MFEITFKRETTPARCEICHQSDLFDPEHNHCQRCDNLPVKQMSQVVDAARVATINNQPRILRFNGAVPILLVVTILVVCSIIAVGIPQVLVPVWIFASIGYLGGVAFESLIRLMIRTASGQLPADINNAIDGWAFLSLGLTIPFGLVAIIAIVNSGPLPLPWEIPSFFFFFLHLVFANLVAMLSSMFIILFKRKFTNQRRMPVAGKSPSR